MIRTESSWLSNIEPLALKHNARFSLIAAIRKERTWYHCASGRLLPNVAGMLNPGIHISCLRADDAVSGSARTEVKLDVRGRASQNSIYEGMALRFAVGVRVSAAVDKIWPGGSSVYIRVASYVRMRSENILCAWHYMPGKRTMREITILFSLIIIFRW